MGGKGSVPKPPDMTAMAQASIESAKIWEGVAREQLEYAREDAAWGRQILESTLGVQMDQMEEAWRQAQDDRQRYERVWRPLEDNLREEFESFDTPERREQAAAERIADVSASFEAQRQNAALRLEGMGVDPSQTRSMALDRGVSAMQAATSAQAGNQGRTYIEQMGRALRAEGINIGRGLPAQVAQSMGIVNQTAGGMTQNFGSTMQANQMGLQGAMGAGRMGMQGQMQGAEIQNMGYQNSLAAWNAEADANAAMIGGVASVAGAAMGAGGWGGLLSMGGGKADGGPVDGPPQPVGPTDTVPAVVTQGIPTGQPATLLMLDPNEYVVPADVVRKKGTEFFDKLLAKYREGGDYDLQRQAVPTGG